MCVNELGTKDGEAREWTGRPTHSAKLKKLTKGGVSKGSIRNFIFANNNNNINDDDDYKGEHV